MSNLQKYMQEDKLKKDFEEAYLKSEKACLSLLEEKLMEAFEIAFCDDYDLRNFLAAKLLDGMDFYLFCKMDSQELLDDRSDEIYQKISGAFYDCEGSTFDIRALAEKAYGGEV